jgi:quinol monooxygenase YgiN
MLIRIVRMTFQPEEIQPFLDHFEEIKSQIRHFPGCLHLKLLRDPHEENVYSTYSHWESEDDLNKYRKSELFGKVWPLTKSRFAENPVAYSFTVVCEID